jgi:hypothetical protein
MRYGRFAMLAKPGAMGKENTTRKQRGKDDKKIGWGADDGG